MNHIAREYHRYAQARFFHRYALVIVGFGSHAIEHRASTIANLLGYIIRDLSATDLSHLGNLLVECHL